jgi:hypothetical protein
VSGLLTAQPFDPADSPREFHHTQSPGKQQIPLYSSVCVKDTGRCVSFSDRITKDNYHFCLHFSLFRLYSEEELVETFCIIFERGDLTKLQDSYWSDFP